jgi:quercetin dioxygenase-like cupin family protein
VHKPFIVNLNSGDSKKFPVLDSGNSYSLHSGLVTLNKDENIGEHTTGSHEELIIVLEGEGEIEAEDAGRKKIIKGDAAYNPPETKHNVYNFNEHPLKYIYIVTKAK